METIHLDIIYYKFDTQNVRIHDQDLNHARTLQQFLIEKKDFHNPDFFIEVYIKMAHELGGDFFQFLKLKEGHYMVSSYDVCGKGITASLATTMVSTFFATIEVENTIQNLNPEQIVYSHFK